MAITPLTGFKAFTFDGETSTDYGVQILGEGVFNAPERVVEMIEIPGRNGTFALDKGRFENIEVTYPANIIADSTADFAAAVSGLRNMLCSRRGYCRLADDYHPDEYRMAVYKEGLEVDEKVLRAGEFEITFDCKPQRFLTSGETAVDVSSGDTITNPTLFESSPMLEVTGYGNIGIDGESITIQNSELGKVKLHGASSSAAVSLDTSLLETGDAIQGLTSGQPYVTLSMKLTNTAKTLYVGTRSEVTNGTVSIDRKSRYMTVVKVMPSDVEFAYGTDKTITTTVPLAVEVEGVVSNATLTVTTVYSSSNDKVTLSASRSGFPGNTFSFDTSYMHPAYYGDSTKTLLPTPMYIDLDIGEAYGEVSGEMVSFNNIVSMPADLPVLAVGSTRFTKSNTITELKVVPRWWKI